MAQAQHRAPAIDDVEGHMGENLNRVGATVRYLNPEWKTRTERPQIGSRETRHANTGLYDVEILDARPLHDADQLALEPNGFLLAEHPSAVHDFRDAEEVRSVYYGEWEPRLRELTGADQILFLHHLLRTETPRDFNDAYARYVHCDFSDTLAANLAEGVFRKQTGASEGEAKRQTYALYNIWQPIEREVQQNPLTVIDATSLERSDVVEYEYTASSETGVASMPIYNPEHRFFYFPRMQIDEAIVFKQLDLRAERSYCCPHTSFHDPSAPEAPLGRRSIELRAVAVFSKG